MQDDGKFVPSRSYVKSTEDDPVIHADETGRRLVRSHAEFVLPAGASPMPLTNPNHAVILVNITHKQQRPRFDCPGFRILGAFPDQPTLLKHVNKYYADSECSLWLTGQHEFFVCSSSTERQQDGTFNAAHLTSLRDFHQRLHSQSDFNSTVATASSGETGKSLYARTKQYHKKQQESSATANTASEAKRETTSPLSAAGLLASQQKAVIVTLLDLRDAVLEGEAEPEPAISVLGVFANKEDATFYSQFTAHKQYPMHQIDVVDMYEWLFPHDVNPDDIPEVYADPQLKDIMNGRKESMRDATRYERFMEERKQKGTEEGIEK